MASPWETEIEDWRWRLVDAQRALATARRRLEDHYRDMAACRRGLWEAQDRLDAIRAADADLNRYLGMKPVRFGALR
jgi:hypothetical protein